MTKVHHDRWCCSHSSRGQSFHADDSIACLMRTVDGYIFVSLHHPITLCPEVSNWRALFRTGKKFTHYHDVLDKSLALPVVHSFTGWDSTSSLFEKGKSQDGKHGVYAEVIQAIPYMVLNPYTKLKSDGQHYCQQYRQQPGWCLRSMEELHCQKDKTSESFPPSQDELL